MQESVPYTHLTLPTNFAVEMSWEVQQEWKYTAKAGGIASLVCTNYECTGCAHGLNATDSTILRPDNVRELSVAQSPHPDSLPSSPSTFPICQSP